MRIAVVALLACLVSACQSQLPTDPVPKMPVQPAPTSVVKRRVEARRGTLQLRSDLFRIDRGFESMAGPSSLLEGFRLSRNPADANTTFWIKGIEAWAESTGSPVLSEEFICHQNLSFGQDFRKFNQQFFPQHHMDNRLLTLVEGRLKIHLPPGFAIPVKGGTPINWDCMTHHLNHQVGEPEARVRIFLNIDFLTDPRESGKPLRPLFRRALYLVDRQALARKKKLLNMTLDPEEDLCSSNPQANAGSKNSFPQALQDNPIHWKVPPGRHRFEMPLDQQLKLPFDTTAHYISGHLHTHHDWIRLVDADTGEVLVQLSGRAYPGRRGLQQMADWSSQQGLPLKKKGHYKLVAQYTNNTPKPIDAMAILYLHMLDQPSASEGNATSVGDASGPGGQLSPR